MKKSPFAPDRFPELPPVAGFDMATAEAGVRYKGRTDLWVLSGIPGTQVAGVYTRNKMPGAPIDWSRQALSADVPHGSPRLVVVNSGTANVFTGRAGRNAVRETAEGIAEVFGGVAECVQIASTGVIGEPLDASKVVAKFPNMKTRMTSNGWEAAARAIMTTDTYPKGATRTAMIGDTKVTLNGIAKGSGMVAPDMGTMLVYIATDAKLPQTVLQNVLAEYCDETFNAITVDSDTSTSDTLLLLASGAVGGPNVSDYNDPCLEGFRTALKSLMLDLAHQVVKDGEGALKFVRIKVESAQNVASARKIALSIANSPLVKTAIAGEDANWGRIVMAVGKSGEPADRDKLSIRFGPHTVAENGYISETYDESKGAAYMRQSELEITVDVGVGNDSAIVWTCDLTHGYIDINADYRS